MVQPARLVIHSIRINCFYALGVSEGGRGARNKHTLKMTCAGEGDLLCRGTRRELKRQDKERKKEKTIFHR